MKIFISAFTALSALYCIQAPAANVEITISDLTQQSGELYLALYNSASAMKHQEHFQSQIISVYKLSQKVVFADLPAGQYGVMVFQDLDNNHDLNSNVIGIPTEPYGFSNNPHLMGPPDFTDIAFNVESADVSLTISME